MLQAQHVIGDIKHYAMNDQESGRDEVDAIISKRAMQETDMLAFHIGIDIGQPAAVMCSYNAINGDYACQNKYILTDVLKKDWAFKGFVVSDWGGTHSTVQSSAAGLDNEQPMDDFYGEKLKQAVQAGNVPMAQLDDHVHRILRSMFQAGLFDFPTQKSVVDVEGGFATARRIAEQSIVLLKNKGTCAAHRSCRGALHCGDWAARRHRYDLRRWIGAGGPAGTAGRPLAVAGVVSHLAVEGVSAADPAAKVTFDSGADPAAAAALARQSGCGDRLCLPLDE